MWAGDNGYLSRPSTRFDQNNEKIEITIIIPKDEAAEFQNQLNEIIDHGLRELIAAEPDDNKKTRIASNKHLPGTLEVVDGQSTGNMKFKFKSKIPPKIFDSEAQEMPVEETPIGDGSTGRLMLGIGRPYAIGSNSGVPFYLNKVQLYRYVSPQKRDTSFSSLEGGFSSSKEDSSQAPSSLSSCPVQDENSEWPVTPPQPLPPPPPPINLSGNVSPSEGVMSNEDLHRFSQTLKGLQG